MAVDVLELCISDMKKDGLALPSPSQIPTIFTDANSYVVLIEFDMLSYN